MVTVFRRATVDLAKCRLKEGEDSNLRERYLIDRSIFDLGGIAEYVNLGIAIYGPKLMHALKEILDPERSHAL